MMHRQAFHRASGGEGITIKDIFQDGLAYLASLAFHPFYPLLAAAIAFNLAIAGRLAEVQQKVSEVEHKTGCHAWSMHHYAKADGDYSSLSARMSVVATTLAANKRLNGMAAEILPTFNAHSDLWQKHATKHTWKETGLVAVHINHLTGRLATQRIHIEYNMARVQNQLTAVRHYTLLHYNLLIFSAAFQSHQSDRHETQDRPGQGLADARIGEQARLVLDEDTRSRDCDLSARHLRCFTLLNVHV